MQYTAIINEKPVTKLITIYKIITSFDDVNARKYEIQRTRYMPAVLKRFDKIQNQEIPSAVQKCCASRATEFFFLMKVPCHRVRGPPL